MVSAGAIVSGGIVRRCILSPGVNVHSYALVEDSVLLNGVIVFGRLITYFRPPYHWSLFG